MAHLWPQLITKQMKKPDMFQTTEYQTLLNKLEPLLKSGVWIKGTISKPAADQEWKNIFLRPVVIKEEKKIQRVTRHPNKDLTHNLSWEEAIEWLRVMLQAGHFKEINLYTSEESILWKRNKKGKATLITRGAPASIQVPPKHHNHQKDYLIPTDAPFLKALGLSNASGNITSDGQRKYRQINKYIEILSGMIDQSNLSEPIKIMDMGSGLGYLSFALFDYLARQKGRQVQMEGIELREPLVDKCNKIAGQLQYKGLTFTAGDINRLEDRRMDILIALHACDIATDMAIAAGIKAEAKLIVLAPCCHKQVRKSMAGTDSFQAIIKHGILLERQAEILTDTIRSLLLEAHGYQSRVFEFINQEHTSKNLMITAERSKPRPEALQEVQALKESFGIREHYLEILLNEHSLSKEVSNT